MKNLLVALTFAAFASISTTSAAAPPPSKVQNGVKGIPKSKKLPQVQANANLQGGDKKKAPQTSMAKSGGYSGVVKSMKIDREGEIQEINLKISGSTRTVWIKGCGAKSASHPLLNWAFQEQRLVHFFADDSSCMVNVDIPR